MKEIFIHVGLPKTGTTFLQRRVFPKMKLNYIPYKTIDAELLDGKNLISDESLAGYSYIENKKLNKTIAKNIYNLYPKAKIIVVFREKEEWLKSCYKQYLAKRERRLKVKDYKDWFEKTDQKNNLDFKKYEEFLKDLFDDVLVLNYEDSNRDKENFVQDIASFIGVSCPSFEDKKENVSFSYKHFKLFRIIDRLPTEHFSNILDGFFRKILK